MKKEQNTAKRGRRPVNISAEMQRYQDGIFSKIRTFYRQLSENSVDSSQRYSVTAIHEAIIKKHGDTAISYDTLRELLNGDKSTTNILLISMICEALGLNICDVVDPNVRILQTSAAMAGKGNNDMIEVLTDEKYTGTFHGYTFSNNHSSNDILSFTLTIKDQEATLVTHNTVVKPDSQKTIRDMTFRGVPLLMRRTNTILLNLIDQYGQYRFISIEYTFYNHQSMYYRRGIMVSTEGKTKKPMVQTILILAGKLSPEDEALYLPGLLKFSTDVFMIKEADLEKLKKEPRFQDFFDTYLHLIRLGSYAFINTRLLIAYIDETSPDYKEKKIALTDQIMQLRRYALLPERIIFESGTEETQMIKRKLMQAGKNPETEKLNRIHDFMNENHLSKEELLAFLESI